MTATTVTTEFSPGDTVYAVVECSSTTECASGASVLSSSTKYSIRAGKVLMVIVRLTNSIDEIEYHIRFDGDAGTTTITQDLDLSNDEKSVFEVLDNTNDTSGSQVVDFGGTITIPGSPAGSPLPTVGLVATQNVAVNIKIDGVTISVSRVATGNETITEVLSDLNTAFGATATAAIVAGDLVITSASEGLTSKVQILNDNYFTHLNGFVEIEDPVDGEGGALEAYQIRIS